MEQTHGISEDSGWGGKDLTLRIKFHCWESMGVHHAEMLFFLACKTLVVSWSYLNISLI